MKIQKVFIERFKVLKDIDVDLKGKNILLIADNERGKSSFMQFCRIAMGETTHLPPNTDGKGHIIVTKDGTEYAFSVVIKDGKSKVVIESEGMKDNRKSALAAIVGAMNFDPNEFVELSKTKAGQKKQVEIYRSFLPPDLKEGLMTLETNYKVAYEERTDLTREIVSLEGAMKKHPMYAEGYANQLDNYKKPEDISEIQEKQNAAVKHNELYEKAITKQEGFVALKNQFEKNISTLEEKIAKLSKELAEGKAGLEIQEENLAKAKENQEKADEWIKGNPKVDTAEFDTAINNSSEANKKYEQAQDLKQKMKDISVMETEKGEATANIESQKEEIARFIREQSPVDELVFDEDRLLYKGMPVHPDSMATSAIIELGIKMKMHENPDLGVLFIERGESLGQEKYQALLDISEKYGWQLLIEQMERGEDKLKIELIGTVDKEKK